MASGTGSPRRLAAVLGAAVALAGSWARAADWRAWESAKVQLHVERIAILERTYRYADDVDARLAQERALIRVSLGRLVTDTPPTNLPGYRLEAYRATNDGSPQPFWRYVPASVTSTSAPPLLILLHGYNPTFDLLNIPGIPAVLGDLADRTGACVAAPFGRSNTDFQGAGEQDVLRVVEEMVRRYGVDRRRLVLSGYSMGGLGTWCLGARFADRFNALLIFCGRADFYVWHGLRPHELPPWQRRLVDTQFATVYLDRLLETPLLAVHGELDDLISHEQGAYPVRELQRRGGRQAELLSYPYDGHGVTDVALTDARVQTFLARHLTTANPRPAALDRQPGFTGSRLQDALLERFAFVGGGTPDAGAARARLAARADEWQRFAKGDAPQYLEASLPTNVACESNLFVFGEPEESPLIQSILRQGGVEISVDAFRLAGQNLPRGDHGLWFTGRNPFNTNRVAVIQCGIAWGEFLADNHRYDRIPDVLAYSRHADDHGVNLAVAAGFLDAQGQVEWSTPAVTPAITRRQAAFDTWDAPTSVYSP